MPIDSFSRQWRRNSTPICPFFPLAAFGIGLVKAFHISSGVSFVPRLDLGIGILYADFSFLSLFFVVLFFECVQSGVILKGLTLILSTVLLFWYFTDTCVIFLLNHRVNLLDFLTYSENIWEVREIAYLALICLAYIILISYVQRFKIRTRPEHAAGGALFLMLLPALGLNFHAETSWFAANSIKVREMLIGAAEDRFSAEELALLHANSPPSAKIATPSPKGIVFLLVESFSACDSFRTSGLFDHFPKFDLISLNGTLFTDFIANSSFTEGGLIAMFSGSPPLVFPTYPHSLNQAYKDQDSPVRDLLRRGYKTGFISSAPLNFRRKKALVSGLGFEETSGRDEIIRFRGAERFSMGAVADGLLYEEALQIITSRMAESRPFFLTVETTSSHLPYIDPLHRVDDETHVLNYVDQQLANFYAELKAKHFFDDGVLIITGDHRKMLPVSGLEREKYGSTAEARVPLLVIGKGVPADRIDHRFLQQSDLLKYVLRGADDGWPISAVAYNVQDYTAPLVGSNPSSVRVFVPSGASYSLSITGRTISWLGNSSPPEKRLIELDLSRRMARLQYCYENAPICASFNTDLNPKGEGSHGTR